ncbi:MAG: polysaccharide lyase family 7 protein [Bacteroidota bacterium]
MEKRTIHNRKSGFSPLTSCWVALAFMLTIGFLPAQTPASNLGGLASWKLNAYSGSFNINQNNNGLTYVDNKQPLSTHSNNNWFYYSNGYTWFKTYVGNPSSGGSGNPRTELREMEVTNSGNTEIYWNGTTSTQYSMKWRVRVDRLPHSGKLAFGQIHSNSGSIDDAVRIQAQGSGNQTTGQIRIRVLGFATDTDDNPTAVSDETGYYFSMDSEIYLELTMQNSIIKLYVLNNSGSRTQTIFTSNAVNATGCYFKAGCYLQSVKSSSDIAQKSTSNYGLVGISEISLNESSSGGGCDNTAVPSNRHVDNIGSSSATLDWNAVSNADHYNVRWRKVGTSSWSYKTSIRNGTQHTISGLSSNTTYQWQVRSKCANNSGAAYGAGPGPNFTTSGNSGNSSGGSFRFVKRNATGYAMDGGSGGANGQSIELWSNINHPNLTWVEIDRGNGYYSYQKLNTNYCIDGGNGGSNDQNVYLWTCSANNQNQHWQKVSVGNGHYMLIKRNASGYAIDGGNGGGQNQNVKLWSVNSSNQNQHWRFDAVNARMQAVEVEAEEPFRLFPNPTSRTLQIQGLEEGRSIRVFNVLGKLVMETSAQKIDVSELSAGIYSVVVEGKAPLKFTKQ